MPTPPPRSPAGGGLPRCETLTVVFHGLRDLGTIQTYVTPAGAAPGRRRRRRARRVPCDLDLGDAGDREEAEHLYAEQAGALRDALVGADTVLDIPREPLEDLLRRCVEVETGSASRFACPPTRCCRRCCARPNAAWR